MKTVEFSPLTRDAIADLLERRGPQRESSMATGNRRTSRWPFPGTVQIWDAHNGCEDLAFASSVNLSVHGVGIITDEEFETGRELAIAIHEPEVSFQGRAVVRHCAEFDTGWFVGLQFVFDQ